jgi:hypothetical protein
MARLLIMGAFSGVLAFCEGWSPARENTLSAAVFESRPMCKTAGLPFRPRKIDYSARRRRLELHYCAGTRSSKCDRELGEYQRAVSRWWEPRDDGLQRAGPRFEKH